MMGCEANGFCSQLTQGLRCELCKGCRRHFIRKGSVENFDDVRKQALLLIDGFILGKSIGDGRFARHPLNYLPRVTTITPGYLINFKETFSREDDVIFASSFIHFETDCCMAFFDQAFLASLYRQSRELREAIAKSMFDWSVSLSELLGVAFAPTMNEKISLLLAYLERYRLCLSEKSISRILECSRTTVSRGFASISEDNPRLFEAYMANKGRAVKLLEPSF